VSAVSLLFSVPHVTTCKHGGAISEMSEAIVVFEW